MINDAIMRKKLGPGGRTYETEGDNISVPSELNSNLWAEVPKYQAIKHQEALKKEKDLFNRKRT